MTTLQKLTKEIRRVPEFLLEEVLDFVHFLEVKKSGEKFKKAALSESSLKKDWLRPEEDAAWQNL